MLVEVEIMGGCYECLDFHVSNILKEYAKQFIRNYMNLPTDL